MAVGSGAAGRHFGIIAVEHDAADGRRGGVDLSIARDDEGRKQFSAMNLPS
ncbi:MAG TPA: hypothetical protein VFZ91_16100 [Allosphingosinicella sp.]